MIGETRIYHLRNRDPNDRVHFLDTGYVMLEHQPRKPKPVLTKADFYRRFYAGEFGNHGPMWRTIGEYLDSGYAKPIAIRSLRRGGRCQYDICRRDASSYFNSFLRDGYHPNELNFSAMSPHEFNLLQGEVMRATCGLSAFISDAVGLPMRPALATARQLVGVAAHVTIKRALCQKSWEWLNHLLDTYQDHVVEFTAFSRPYGVIRGMNTVFWEVRAY